MALSGEAARLAEVAGITDVAVSISHEAQFAVAVVVAHASPGDDGLAAINEGERDD